MNSYAFSKRNWLLIFFYPPPAPWSGYKYFKAYVSVWVKGAFLMVEGFFLAMGKYFSLLALLCVCHSSSLHINCPGWVSFQFCLHRFFRLRSFIAMLILFFYCTGTEEVIDFRPSLSQHSILPYDFWHLLTLLGFYPGRKAQFPLVADPTDFSGIFLSSLLNLELDLESREQALFLRDPHPFTLSILCFFLFPPIFEKYRSLFHVR